MASKTAATPSPFRLPPIVDALQAEEMRKPLLALLRGKGLAELNGEAVEQIATPAVQTLLAFDRSLTRDGRQLVLTDASPALRSAFTDLGLSDILKKWTRDIG